MHFNYWWFRCFLRSKIHSLARKRKLEHFWHKICLTSWTTNSIKFQTGNSLLILQCPIFCNNNSCKFINYFPRSFLKGSASLLLWHNSLILENETLCFELSNANANKRMGNPHPSKLNREKF